MSGGGQGGGGSGAANSDTQAKRLQVLQQQQNLTAQHNLAEKLRNTLGLLSNGFNKLNSSGGGFQLMRTAASGLVSSSSNSSSSSSFGQANNHHNHHHSPSNHSDSNDSAGGNSMSSQVINSQQQQQQQQQVNNSSSGSSVVVAASSSVSSSSSHQINREVRVGVTYAYVELANLLGSNWLERNLRMLITAVLNLINGTKSVATHLDAVYSRKCVQFILRAIIGGMLNEKMQLEAARILLDVVDKCTRGVDFFDEPRPTSKSSNNSGLTFNRLKIIIIYANLCLCF